MLGGAVSLTMIDLDEPRVASQPGHERLHTLIEEFPEQVAAAWSAGLEWAMPANWVRPDRVLVAGLGGSAIGADIVATLALATGSVPIQVVRGYSMPPLTERTLVVGCSFSGETAETLAAMRDASGPGMRLVISTGGNLARLADEQGWARFPFVFDGPPRTALGWSTFSLLAILARLGVVDVTASDIDTLVAALHRGGSTLTSDVPGEMNRAKQVARAIAGGAVLVAGAGALEVAARRWAGQLSENAKQWAVFGALPEVNHNLLVALSDARFPSGPAQPMVVLLDAPALEPRLSRQVALLAETLASSGVRHEVVRVHSSGTLGAILEACQLGDWVSLYAAALNEVDPMDIDALDRFKRGLA